MLIKELERFLKDMHAGLEFGLGFCHPSLTNLAFPKRIKADHIPFPPHPNYHLDLAINNFHLHCGQSCAKTIILRVRGTINPGRAKYPSRLPARNIISIRHL